MNKTLWSSDLSGRRLTAVLKKNRSFTEGFFTPLKTVLLALLFLLISVGVSGQTTIVAEGLNNSSTLFAVSGGTYSTGNSAAADRPATSPYASEGTYSYGATNSAATLTSTGINTSTYTGISMSMRLASFSLGSTTNGADGTDIVTVEVSPDGGTNYYSTVRVLGNTNAYWAYSTGTGNASTAYDGNTTPTDFTPAAGGNRTTDGYSTITVTGLPSVGALRVRITLLNNATAERWVLDDFKMTGTAAATAITSFKTGNWSDTTTWAGGVVPTSAVNAVIANGHTVTLDTTAGGINTRDVGTTTTVNAGGTLATAVQYINKGTTTINGAFQINNGGYANTDNNFVYVANGTLNFNNSGGSAVNNGDQFWPIANGPFNITILQGGMTLNAGANRTVAGILQTASGVLFPSATLTLNGTAQINVGGYFGNSPIYGNASTLIYNSDHNINGTYGKASEWTQGAGTIGVTPGYPQNVQLSNGTFLDYPNGSTGIYKANGNVTVDANSALYQGFSGASAGLIVGGNLTLNGDLSLGSAVGGDLTVMGNWTKAGTSTFTPNSNAVFFSGNAIQTITGATTFDYLTINNSAGVNLASPITTRFNLDLTLGKLTLGANDLTIGGSGTIVNSTSAKYVVSNGVGQLKRTVGNASVLFPIGTLAIYNPISVINNGTSDVYGFRVATGVSGALDLNYMVKDSWFASEAVAGGGNLRVVPQWNTTDEGSSFSVGDNFIELYTPPTPTITEFPATVTSQSATLTNPGDNFTNTLTGAQYFAVSKHRPQEINIKQGSTNILTGGTYAVTSQVSGTSSTAVTFTVENTGQANLTLGTLTKSGTDATMFTVTQPVSSTVAPNGTTTFTVVFSPNSVGAKTAQLSLVNNDTDENPYVINLTGTGTASAASDIAIKTGFIYPQNIPYANYQATDITGGANDIEIAKFTIRDGATTTDADNLGTALSQLTLSTTNFSNIRRIALYDGPTEIVEQAGAATNTFNGLNLVAPDNGTKDFSVRVSFNTAVTDNQNIGFTVSATTTATAIGSAFAATTAGGAATSVTGNDNKIAVLADRLAFTTQPLSGGINTNLSTFTISAVDINSNVDLDAAKSIVLTTSGTGITSTSPYLLTSGKVDIADVQFNALQTGITLTGTTTGLAFSNTITSTAFDIEEDAALIGDYKTINDGLWNVDANWQIKTAGGWAATTYPFAGTGVTLNASIIIKNKVRFNLAFQSVYSNVTINNGAELTINISGGNFTIAAGGKLLIKSGAKYYNQTITTVRAGATLEVEDGADFYNSYSGNPLNLNLFLGKEIFHPNSNFRVVNSDTGLLRDFTVLTPFDDGNGNIGYFGNIIFETAGNSLNMIYGEGTAAPFTAANPDYNITNGDLIFRTGVSTATIRLIGVSNINTSTTASSLAKPYTVGGNLIIESGFLGTVLLRDKSVTTYFKVKKDVILNGSGTFTMGNSSVGVYLYAEGNMNIKDTSKFYFVPNSGVTSIYNLYLKGDLSVASTAFFTNLNTAAGASNANLYFVGLGDGSSDALTQTIDIAPLTGVRRVSFTLAHPTYGDIPYVKLKNSLYFGPYSEFIVRNKGTLDFGFDTSGNALNILKSSGATNTNFAHQTDSTLKITSPDGITTDITPSVGNVQTDTRTFAIASPFGDYYFIGNAAQSTGNSLPINVRNLIINNTSNTNEVTLNNASINVNASLDVQKGIFNLNDKATTGTNTSTLNIEGGATLKIAGTKTFPTGFTGTNNITLKSTSIVEYGGTIQSIANTGATGYPNLPAYQTLKISGNGVKTASGTTTVNEKTKITSDAATLLVPAYNPAASPPVYSIFYASSGIENTSPSNVASAFILGNDANLMQDLNAVNTGNISAQREITIKDNKQYNYLISPLAGSNLKTDLYGTGNSAPFTLYHNESNNKFYNSSGAYIAGRGLAVKEPATGSGKINAVFKGVPTNGSFTYTLANSGTAATGYNLIGNPYPSNIDLDVFYNLNTNRDKISATFYFWDNTVNTRLDQGGNSYNGAAYAVFNAVAGNTGTGLAAGSLSGGITGSKEPTRVVKTGQGFMVRSISTTNKTIDFTNGIRIKDSGVFFGKSAKENTEDDRFYLKFDAPTNITTQTAIVYFADGNNGFANDDSEIIGDPSDALYSFADQKKVIINGKTSFVVSDKVDLGAKMFTTGNYTIGLGNKEGIFANGQSIYLKDKLTNIVTNLSQGSYTFLANAGESTGRFEIIYQPDTVLATDANLKERLVVYKDGNDFVVKAKVKKITALEVYDTSGRLMGSVTPNSVKAIVSAENLPNGVYILKIDQHGEITSRKMIR